jgi:hypothetical protein
LVIVLLLIARIFLGLLGGVVLGRVLVIVWVVTVGLVLVFVAQ